MEMDSILDSTSQIARLGGISLIEKLEKEGFSKKQGIELLETISTLSTGINSSQRSSAGNVFSQYGIKNLALHYLFEGWGTTQDFGSSYARYQVTRLFSNFSDTIKPSTFKSAVEKAYARHREKNSIEESAKALVAEV